MSAWTKGDHIDHPRSGIDDQTFVDEYKHLKESGVTEHEVREVLRMSVPAFDKALERAKTRGDL